MSRIIKALLTMTAITAAVLLGSAPAQAAEPTPEDATLIAVPDWSDPAGTAAFNQDPSGSAPGDAFFVCDEKSDNRYVKAYLDIDQDGDYDRSATTKGHKAGYCSPWTEGNISEGNQMDFWVCTLYDGDWKQCSGRVEVTA